MTRSARPPPWAIAALLALAALGLYARTAGFPLIHFDDYCYLANNPYLRGGLGWSSAAWAATTLYFSNWHPLTWLSWLAEVSLFGPSPAAFHLGNALLHAVAAALLFAALRALTGATWRSALAAALFALHPVQVEAVAWASERKELLAAVFGLLALLAHARHAARPSPGRLALTALAFAASLASKPSWVTLPCLLVLLDLWPLGRLVGGLPPAASPARWPETQRRSLAALVLEKAPLLLLAAGSSAITLVAQRSGGAMVGLELGLGDRAANALVAYLQYLGAVLWPAGLSIFYPHPVGGLPAWQVAGAGLLLAALLAAALRPWRRAPELALGLCWFLGALVPVIGLVQVGGQARADRYLYLPGIGLWILAAWGAGRLAARPGWRSLVGVSAVLVLTVLAAVSWRQVGAWRSHEALFSHAIEVDPDNARAHAILSSGLWTEGRRVEALAEARRAVELAPGSGQDWSNLSEMLRSLGQREEALRAAEVAVQAAPGFAPAWIGLAAAQAEAGRLDEAERALRRALMLRPGDAATWRELGKLLAFQGRAEEATQALRETLRLEPRDGLR